LVRSFGADVVSSGDLVQQALCSYSAAQIESHARAMTVIETAKDAAFALIGDELRAGRVIKETDIQNFLMQRFSDAHVLADHPPIVAVNGHAAAPHYAPSEQTPTPIRRGDTVLIDLWAVEPQAGAVYADITWMAHCGDRPPDRVSQVFRVVTEARDRGLETI